MLSNTGGELSHFAKYLIGLEKPRTQTTNAEQEAIKEYSKNKNSAVEIGVFEGVNTLNIAKSLNGSGVLYAIDPFLKGRIGICYGELISNNYIKRANLNTKVRFIKKYSSDATVDVPGEVDFIFIDGDHSYEGIKKDWNIWKKKVTKNGVIALHDTSFFGKNHSVLQLGSYKYFNERIKNDTDFELIETVDSMNILRRIVE